MDIRTRVAYHFGNLHGPFGHTEAARFFPGFRHGVWTNRLRREAQRSRELFVTHFRKTYVEFPDLPVWVVTETMSFGTLSQMYKGMIKADKKEIARYYHLQPYVLESWMHHLVYARNLCAHHSRLWDRIWAIKPVLPHGQKWSPPLLPGNNRLFVTALILWYFLSHIPAVRDFATAWHSRVADHLEQPPAVHDSLNLMGLTDDWSDHPVWK